MSKVIHIHRPARCRRFYIYLGSSLDPYVSPSRRSAFASIEEARILAQDLQSSPSSPACGFEIVEDE